MKKIKLLLTFIFCVLLYLPSILSHLILPFQLTKPSSSSSTTTTTNDDFVKVVDDNDLKSLTPQLNVGLVLCGEFRTFIFAHKGHFERD